jgi:hypothetical protein
MAPRFAWDKKKNQANRRKHRIGFETAVLVFDDTNAIALQDRDVGGEQRWRTIGWAHTSIIVVAHTIGEGNGTEMIRIISARNATPLRREAV